MKEIVWQDTTSHTRDDPDRTPGVWSLKLEDLNIVVHRLIGLEDTWFVSCTELRIRDRELRCKHIKSATKEALAHVRSVTKALYFQARLTTQAKWPKEDA